MSVDGNDDEDAVGPLGPNETRQDEAGLDRLSEAHLVGEEPADRLVGRRPLGDVELVGVDGEPPAEEGPEPLRLPHPLQEEAVEAIPERGGPVDVEAGEPLDGILRDLGGPEAVLLDPATVRRRPVRRTLLLRGESHDLPGFLDPGVAPRGEFERLQAGVARAKSEPLAGPREEDDDSARLDFLDPPGAEVSVVLVEDLCPYAGRPVRGDVPRHEIANGAPPASPGQGPGEASSESMC